MPLHDTLTKAEPAFRRYLESSTKLDWKLQGIEKASSGETEITWKGDKGKLILVVSTATEKAAEARLFYEDPRGMPDQPKTGRVSLDKIDDPKAVLGTLLGKFKQLPWKTAAFELRQAADELQRANRIAAKKLDPKDLKEIKELTQANDHVGADIMRAYLLGAKKLEQKLQLVKKLVELEGGMAHGLRDYAYGLHENVIALGKQNLSPEDFAEFRR